LDTPSYLFISWSSIKQGIRLHGWDLVKHR